MVQPANGKLGPHVQLSRQWPRSFVPRPLFRGFGRCYAVRLRRRQAWLRSPTTAAANRTNVPGSGTAAARAALVALPVDHAAAPPSVAVVSLAFEVVATVPLVSLVCVTVSVASVSVASVAGEEAPDNAPNTT